MRDRWHTGYIFQRQDIADARLSAGEGEKYAVSYFDYELPR